MGPAVTEAEAPFSLIDLADLVVDWDALPLITTDVVAWVYVPGPMMNYPLAHLDGDSDYYLPPTFRLGEGSFGTDFGSLLLSGENAGDFSDEVNILYGHPMRNGSMFPLFADLRDSNIFLDHGTIYLLRPMTTTVCEPSLWSTCHDPFLHRHAELRY